MVIASGIILVLFTWLIAVVSLISLGLLPALAVSRSQGVASRAWSSVLRRSLWWGLVLASIAVTLINLVAPMQSATAAVIMLALILSLGTPGWVILVRTRSRPAPCLGGRAGVLLWCSLIASIVYLAAAALGPVTNYDTGLYHLGAVRYAAEFATVPGLANLYFPLGYASVEFPVAALLGNGPWQQEGFRLLNGLIMTMAALELWWRSRLRGPGFYVTGVGILCAWIPFVAMSDFWITSPTQDASVFVLTVVAAGYFSQAVSGGDHWRAEGATAAVLGIVLVLIRPTMIVWSAIVIVVGVVLIVRRRSQFSTKAFVPIILVTGFAVSAAAAIGARDRLLSGWLQYPLTLYAFDVPWLASDPYWDRAATLGYHRDPENLWDSVSGWTWLEPWLRDRLVLWETYALLGLFVVAGLAVLLVLRGKGPQLRGRHLLVSMLPSVLGTLFWLIFTPPSYRFAWGVVFSVGTIPLGWALWRLSRLRPARWETVTAISIAIPILTVTGFSAFERLDLASTTDEREWTLGGITLPYAVSPLPDPQVSAFITESGLQLMQPVDTEQCWSRYPLCTPRPMSTLRQRGLSVADGFLP